MIRNTYMIGRIEDMGFTSKINCWGSTVSLFETVKITDHLSAWFHVNEMEEWIDKKTKKVKKTTRPKIGDIVVFRRPDGFLEHTAVYIGKGKYWHKPGIQSACETTLRQMRKMYKEYGATKISWIRYKGD